MQKRTDNDNGKGPKKLRYSKQMEDSRNHTYREGIFLAQCNPLVIRPVIPRMASRDNTVPMK
ncbi:hypothetical protein J14TS2_07320 [Bacillus sp. J14TS2]|nr:hypothetical protein J14TS2_07320 [Bacillus sp. J14TS2]